jgi:hypothetical protein
MTLSCQLFWVTVPLIVFFSIIQSIFLSAAKEKQYKDKRATLDLLEKMLEGKSILFKIVSYPQISFH